MIDHAHIAAELATIADPWQQLRRAAELVPSGRLALGTSGQLTGTAIIEGARQASVELRVFTVDTLRLFPETQEYFARLESHYGIRIERATPDDDELNKMIAQHGMFLFFDSKGKQEYCCEIRKVRPNYRALVQTDIWVTGLRHDQSEFRKGTPAVQVTEIPLLDQGQHAGTHKLVKLAPLVNWNEADTRNYLARHRSPIHPLLETADSDWFFESLGCVICTTRQAKWEAPRAGRWRWFNYTDPANKECGIHLPPPSHFQDAPPPGDA